MDKDSVIGAGQVAGAGYIGYQGISHGLPRALGIRIEYHTTSKANADMIKKAGNILDPAFGGKNGWAAKIKCDEYIKRSKGYVHITGIHKDCKLLKQSLYSRFMAPFIRNSQNAMYRVVGNSGFKRPTSTKEIFSRIVNISFRNKTKRFCIPGIDSYFNKEFIPDVDDIALKSVKKLKVNTTRLGAMISGLKKFGLKGIKENKGRVAAGIAILGLTAHIAYSLCKKGFENMKAKQNTIAETNSEVMPDIKEEYKNAC